MEQRAETKSSHTDEISSYSSLSYPYPCMANISDVKAVPSAAIARWENEGGAPSRPERDKVMSRFVPPIVVPVSDRLDCRASSVPRMFLIDPSLERESRGYERTVGGHGGFALRRVRRSDGHQACGDGPKRRRVGAPHLRVRRVRS